jgi:putative PIN family toxin of toxin-antitoxin system
LLRLALDTNIWISAFLTPGGTCEKLIRAPHRESLRFLTSAFILGELEEVLTRKIGLPPKMTEEQLRYVLHHSILVPPGKKIEAVENCEEDNRILECAVAGRASYLVTGDKSHLLPLGRYESIEIVTPRHMVELLKI